MKPFTHPPQPPLVQYHSSYQQGKVSLLSIIQQLSKIRAYTDLSHQYSRRKLHEKQRIHCLQSKLRSPPVATLGVISMEGTTQSNEFRLLNNQTLQQSYNQQLLFSYLILLSVLIRTHWGTGRFWFLLRASTFLTLKVLWDAYIDKNIMSRLGQHRPGNSILWSKKSIHSPWLLLLPRERSKAKAVYLCPGRIHRATHALYLHW